MEIKSKERGITGVPLFQVVLSWNHFTQCMHSYISNLEMIWKGFWRSEWAPCGAAELGAARGGSPSPWGSARRGDTGTSLPATAQGWMPSSIWHKVPWRRDHNAIRLSNRARPLKKQRASQTLLYHHGDQGTPSKSRDLAFGIAVFEFWSYRRKPQLLQGWTKSGML